MRIVVVRRVVQVFFVLLAFVLAFVATPGEGPIGMRGWPVSWMLELDPLVALGTILATGTLYAGLAWALVTVALTLVFGRVFCGWICPFGALHQFIGWLGRRRRKLSEQFAVNRPHKAQVLKYYILIWMLVAAAGDFLIQAMRASFHDSALMAGVVAIVALVIALLAARRIVRRWWAAALVVLPLLVLWWGVGYLSGPSSVRIASLQTGLLDPIPLFFRSIHLAVLPLLDDVVAFPWGGLRTVSGAWLVGAIFVAALLVNLWSPRFYCRYLCPLGALLGLLGRNALWRVSRVSARCTDCDLCEQHCEGACSPSEKLAQQ